MKKTHASVTEGGTAISRYQGVVVGNGSLIYLLYYEFCMMLSPIPGALGLFLRKLFWPRLFGSCGKGAVFGVNIALRHPRRIHLGDRVVISEGCIIDARNIESAVAIELDSDVILSNNVMISCKNGKIKIGARTGINTQSIVQSTNKCPVVIGADVIIGPRCYIVGGGNYKIDRSDIPIWRQGIKADGGINLEDDIWLGANVTVLGGVTMGKGCVAAAGALVNKPVPSMAICGGLPARIMDTRAEDQETNIFRRKK